jgi:GNAT superfamily N-acetyltransferase
VTLEMHAVTAERWLDFVELFERRGPRGGRQNAPAYGCWCMWWRDRSCGHGEPKKRAMKRIVAGGGEPGLLAYADGVPVAWVSIAPREQYEALLRSPQYRPRQDEEGVWSIVCFTVDKGARGEGLRERLLAAAVEHAFARGARAVEAYPHLEKRDDYMGHIDVFVAHGFEPVRETSKRAVVRRERGVAGRTRAPPWRYTGLPRNQ